MSIKFIKEQVSYWTLDFKIQGQEIVKNGIYEFTLFVVYTYDNSILHDRIHEVPVIGLVKDIDYNKRLLVVDASKDFKSNIINIKFDEVYKVKEYAI